MEYIMTKCSDNRAYLKQYMIPISSCLFLKKLKCGFHGVENLVIKTPVIRIHLPEISCLLALFICNHCYTEEPDIEMKLF